MLLKDTSSVSCDSIPYLCKPQKCNQERTQGGGEGAKVAFSPQTNAQNFHVIKLIYVGLIVKCPASITWPLKVCQTSSGGGG